MARDTFVYWDQRHPRPTKQEIQHVLEDYVRGLATTVVWERDRWYVTLPGESSWSFQRSGPATIAQRTSWLESSTRWFEVWIGDDNIDVITRMADDVTNVIAHGFASLMARGFDGRIDDQ